MYNCKFCFLNHQILALRLLRSVLPSWDANKESERMSDVVAKLFALLGQVLMTCHGSLPVQLSIGTLRQTATVRRNKRTCWKSWLSPRSFGKKNFSLGIPSDIKQTHQFKILQVSSMHFHFVLYAWFLGERSRKSKRKSKIPASVSATYSSTVAEELLALIRKLHALEAWNPLVNEFISAQLRSIVTMVTDVRSVKKEPVIQVWFSLEDTKRRVL